MLFVAQVDKSHESDNFDLNGQLSDQKAMKTILDVVNYYQHLLNGRVLLDIPVLKWKNVGLFLKCEKATAAWEFTQVSPLELAISSYMR